MDTSPQYLSFYAAEGDRRRALRHLSHDRQLEMTRRMKARPAHFVDGLDELYDLKTIPTSGAISMTIRTTARCATHYSGD
jgi:hypothetical protein